MCILKPTGKLSSRPMFLWSITGPGLVTFLDQILPFLKIKRSRAEVVLSYYRGLKHLQKISTAEKAAEISRRTDLHLALRQLNRAA